jgi:hypothetical protein
LDPTRERRLRDASGHPQHVVTNNRDPCNNHACDRRDAGTNHAPGKYGCANQRDNRHKKEHAQANGLAGRPGLSIDTCLVDWRAWRCWYKRHATRPTASRHGDCGPIRSRFDTSEQRFDIEFIREPLGDNCLLSSLLEEKQLFIWHS